MTTFAPFDPDAARAAAATVVYPDPGDLSAKATGYRPAVARRRRTRDLGLRYSVDDARRDLGMVTE